MILIIKKQQENIKFYSKLGFWVYNKPLEKNKYGNKGNLDVEISWEISKNYNKYKTIVLVSGDGDFIYMLDDLQDNCKVKILIISAKKFTKKTLIQKFEYLDIVDCDILRQKTKPQKG